MNLDHSKKYVLACSFGPDSMALFAMLYEEGYSFVVAHVNYHKRDVSNFEERSLRKYCAERNIPIRVLNAEHAPAKVNFQEWARELRYAFFKQVSEEFVCDAILVAHQEDDLFETYFMQKKRGSYVNYYGIKDDAVIMNCHILRPLLMFSKKELQEYDDSHDIPYSIDCSNLTNDYSRNKIRHEIVEKLTKNERFFLHQEIDEKNANNKPFDISSFLNGCYLKRYEVVKLDNNDFCKCLFTYMDFMSLFTNLSSSFLFELKKSLSSLKQNFIMKIANLEFVVEYNDLYVRKQNKDHCYSYIISSTGSYLFPEFSIELTDDSLDRNIAQADYPLTIRNAKSDDLYFINNYECKLRRLFIDWKMPLSLRSSWPIILNKNNEVIYVPRYRNNYCDKHKTKFVINTTYLRLK